MYKKYLLIFLILIPSTYALSIDLDYTTLGPEQDFFGYIEIPPGNYDPNSIIKVSTTDSSDSEKLKDVIDCDEIDCTGVLDYYRSISATEPTITGEDILTGIRIPEGVTSIKDSEFDIENADSDYPDYPTIDIGNDDNPEWIYSGYATDTFSTDFSGPQIPETIEEVEISSTGNCQRFLLQKSIKYQVQAYVKTTQTTAPTLDIFIHGIDADGTCEQPTSSFDWRNCNLTLTEPIETNYYHICLVSNPGNNLSSNSSAQSPQAYTGSLKHLEKDYIIQVRGAEYVSELKTRINYNESNTRPGEYLSFTLGSYYKNCNFYDGYCTIPIKVSSKNNKTIKLSNLQYKITKDDTTIKTQFLSAAPTKTSGENRIISSNNIIIPLSEFDITTPEDIDEYELSIEFDNEIKKINYNVKEIPIAKFNLSKETASVLEQISFDASESISPDDNPLKYKWDFGDNKTASSKKVIHRYLISGTYTITLNVTDTKKNISSMPFKKTIEIFSSGAEIKNLISSTLSKIDSAISNMNSADATAKQIYTDLDFNQKLTRAKSTLTTYQSKVSTLSQQQLQTVKKNIDEILATLPSQISITRTLDVVPYLSYDDINEIYPDKTSSYKETLHNLNSRITQKTESKLIRTTYLSSNIENYILVKKTITPQNSLKDVLLIELIPLSLTTSENINFFNNLQPEIIISGNYVKAEMSYDDIDSSTTILYKLQSSDIDLVKNIKTIIVPEDLKEKAIPFECGNNVCNPAEDYLSCPEDCTCGNGKCDFDEDKRNCPQDCRKTPWLFIFFFLLLIAVIVGIGYYAHKHPSFAKKLKIEKIINKINLDKLFKILKRNPFETETEFKTVVGFVRRSKKKGYQIMKIRQALERKGWSQEKINYAIKKSKS